MSIMSLSNQSWINQFDRGSVARQVESRIQMLTHQTLTRINEDQC